MERIRITKGEADALLDAAGQMETDFEDYYSFMPKAKLKKHHDNFLSGMEKLKQIRAKVIKKKPGRTRDPEGEEIYRADKLHSWKQDQIDNF